MRRIVRTLLAIGLAGAIVVGGSPARAQHTVSSWSIQLQGDLAPLRASKAPLLVADIDHVRTHGGLASLQQGPNGRRTVLSYLSIGEAETSRPYWQRCCARATPAWLSTTTQGWAGNYLVRYWEPAWQEIIRAGLKQIIADGYDGVYLDRVDSWEAMSRERRSARSDMVSFVIALAREARAIRPGFLIFVQNGEELLEHPEYVAAIDGIGKEDLYHGVNHDQARNPATMIAHSCALLDVVVENKKSVLVLEYLPNGAIKDGVAREAAARGYVITFANRAVDGGEPR